MEQVKAEINIPLIMVGRLDPDLGEQVLARRKTDFVAMGRRLLADPELPNKVAPGRIGDVTPCIACMDCIDHVVSQKREVRCSVNPALGMEPESVIEKSAKPKKVLVAGGGPAGLESARVSAIRGHQVTLWEKEAQLGGQLRLAVIPPGKERVQPLIDYLEAQVKKLGVKIELSKEATPELVSGAKPDAVILATGPGSLGSDIPGSESATVVSPEEVLTGEAKVGEKIVIIGGGLVGCETADFLTEENRDVTILEMLPKMAAKMTLALRYLLLSRLKQKGVAMLTNVTVERFTTKGITIMREGRSQTLDADTIVWAAGTVPDTGLFKAVNGKVPEVYVIGDSREPRNILESMAEGFRTGQKI
ncbi:FAD-dependent oxidoreductase, partial [Thermodesulfobacteriota bacterium]